MSAITQPEGRRAALPRFPRWLAAYVAVVVLFAASRVLVGASFASLNGFWNILVLASFIALAGAGQGLVVLTGGIDLSIPWVITLAGVLVSGWTNGDNGALVWVVPAVVGIAVVVGVINGLGVVALGISPVVFTIAMNVILEGVVLVLTDGTPKGEAPPMLKQIMHDRIGGIPLIAFVLVVFAVVIGLLMSRTTFGQRVYALGTNENVARLSGVNRTAVLLGVYALSAVTAALAGMALTGYASQSYLGMGDLYLLPSIAAVVIGGSSILGGRGHYAGPFAGAVFLALLGSVTTAMGLSNAMQQVLYGLVVLVAVIAVRDRRPQ
jgi:ribose transport system permease protein